MAVIAVTPVVMVGRRRGQTAASAAQAAALQFLSMRQFVGIGRAETEHHGGNFVVEREEAHVFGSHHRFRVFNVIRAQCGNCHFAQALGQGADRYMWRE